jgi:5-(carboxyamino)imidazole ribonucleotide synthase
MLIKTRFGAYDGRGNMVVDSPERTREAWDVFSGQDLYAEKFVPFTKELAVMAGRSMDGELIAYPVVETVHERNICVEVIAPAEVPESVAAQAHKTAMQVAGLLKGAGMFGIEMFLTNSGEVVVNEVAPRVHNSGHYTMEGARTSQFEQHIRAITGLPLGETAMSATAAVMINILGEGNHPAEVKGLAEALDIPGVHVHLYGKSPTKIDRKMGHITAVGQTISEARERAREARRLLSI